MYRGFGVEIVGKPATIRFPSGAQFKVGHLKDRKSYEKYLGHEYQRILIEELTLIPQERYYIEIMGSCRSTVSEISPQMFFTTNPGGPGHGWVKRRFVTPAPWGTPFVGEDGRSRIFIPANIDDNPVLQEKDPGYIKYLDGLKKTDNALWKAWRLGDWDSFVGQAFMEWQHYKHVVSNFDIPVDRFDYKIICFDWGYNAPGVASWLGVLPENRWGVRRVYLYREIYQNKTTPAQWKKDIEKYTSNEKVKYMVLPHDCFYNIQGTTSIADILKGMKNGDGTLHIKEGKTLERGARLNRKAILHDYLADSPDGKPYFQVHQNCTNFIRTLPELVLDETNPEDINSESDDHCFDSVSLGLMTIGRQKGQSGSLEHKHRVEQPTVKRVGDNEYLGPDFWEVMKNPPRKKGNPEFN